MSDILERLDITSEELTYIIDNNPSLRGMITGYMAEAKLEQLWFSDNIVSKNNDHDRRKKGDLLVHYRDRQFTFESKSIQTSSILKTDAGWTGKVQIDASDCRNIVLPDGSNLTTTCLLKDEFDILAINIFPVDNVWKFLFIKNSDLPSSKCSKYTAYQRDQLLSTSVSVSWPPKPPFYEEPFTLMDDIINNR
jgi:hypothetical protein